MVITEQLKTTIKQYGHFMVRHFTETGYRGTYVELHDKRDGFSFLLFTLNVVVYPSISVQHILCYVFSLFCVPYVASFSGLSIFDSPSVFSNVYRIY